MLYRLYRSFSLFAASCSFSRGGALTPAAPPRILEVVYVHQLAGSSLLAVAATAGFLVRVRHTQIPSVRGHERLLSDYRTIRLLHWIIVLSFLKGV